MNQTRIDAYFIALRDAVDYADAVNAVGAAMTSEERGYVRARKVALVDFHTGQRLGIRNGGIAVLDGWSRHEAMNEAG